MRNRASTHTALKGFSQVSLTLSQIAVMPIIFNHRDEDTQIGIWEVEEPLGLLRERVELDPVELQKLESFKHPQRKVHFLAARLLLEELGGKPQAITYKKNGKPICPEFELSISHCTTKVALGLSSTPMGVDIQRINPKIERIAGKFMSENEMKNLDPSNPIEHLHVYWGAKESLFKLHSEGNLHFKKDLIIEDFSYTDQGEITGHIVTANLNSNHRLVYKKLDDYMLVYVVNK